MIEINKQTTTKVEYPGIGIMALMVAAADDREERGLLPEDKEGSDNGRR